MSVRLEGRGLHTGGVCAVTLERRAGPVVISADGVDTEFSGACVVDATRSTSIAVGANARIATVEHLAAALFACGVRDSLFIRVEGAELPLLDGAALAWCGAIAELGTFSGSAIARELRVVRSATIRVGGSTYEFTPSRNTVISSAFRIDEARFSTRASWDGTRDSFVRSIASARTFTREADVTELVALGKASHVAAESVVVLCTDRVLFAGAPFLDDEPARHKLLDLIGDIYVRCGVLTGRVHADRPGHAANHRALDRALAEKIIA